jgi:hypothetical protein
MHIWPSAKGEKNFFTFFDCNPLKRLNSEK